MTAAALSHTSLPEFELLKRGKVRDVYTVDEDHLLIVATDRISAFDCILPTPIARKGEVLTSLSRFWFEKLREIVPSHFVTTDFERMPAALQGVTDLEKRSMLVRGGRGFSRRVCGAGLFGWFGLERLSAHWRSLWPQASRKTCSNRPSLQEPIFTPSTKAEEGHDENISEDTSARSAWVRKQQTTYAKLHCGFTTKRAIMRAAAESSLPIPSLSLARDQNGQIILVDEALTPDSSRFWPAESYSPGNLKPHSINSLFATIWRRWTGTRQPPRHRCQRKSPRHDCALPGSLPAVDRRGTVRPILFQFTWIL